VKTYIRRSYAEGDKYINENIDSLMCSTKKDINKDSNKDSNKINKDKDNLSQEAHEAIRPTNISLFELPENVTDNKERRMYKLIWEHTLESCMSAALFHSIAATISAFQNNQFKYTCELVHFPGWKIVSKRHANEISTENREYYYLQQIKQNDLIPYKKMYAKVTIKGSKLHYTEAKLVQLLEERGIGRPSTFSSLIDKIQERGYVKKEDIKGKELLCNDYELSNGDIFEIETKREFGNEKGKLVLQPLGQIVMEFLEKHFSALFDYNYTKEMEDELDKIAKGEMNWVALCDKCNKQIDSLANELKDEPKFEMQIDENNTYIIGKYGPVIKCVEEVDGKEETKFKPVKKDIDIHKIESGHYTLDEMVDTTIVKKQHVLGKHNGHDVVLKKGKFGLYISWDNKTKNLKELGNRPMENITFDEIKKYLDEAPPFHREISTSLSIRKGPKGDYIFFKTAKMKKPQFYDIKPFLHETNEDYKICNINILKSWIDEKYNVR
jgi:DNA topoisomerase-1